MYMHGLIYTYTHAGLTCRTLADSRYVWICGPHANGLIITHIIFILYTLQSNYMLLSALSHLHRVISVINRQRLLRFTFSQIVYLCSSRDSHALCARGGVRTCLARQYL